MYVVNAYFITVSRTSIYPGTNQIPLTINVKYVYNPVMIDPKSNGAILNLFNQNMEPHGYNLSTPLLLGSIL